MASSNSQGKGSVLSRDELLHGLIGDGLSEIIARPSSGRIPSSKQKPHSKKDVSDLTKAETAALLAEQQSTKPSLQSTSRLYAVPKREREYHKLLHEQVPSLTAPTSAASTAPVIQEDDPMGERASFVTSHRARSDPQIIQRSVVPKTAANNSSSDSDATSADETAPPRQRSTASSSDSDDDRRRARVQRVRQRPKQEAVILQVASHPTDVVDAGAVSPARETKEILWPSDEKAAPTAGSDDSSSASSSSEEDDSSSDDDDDAVDAIVRPAFVPKHLRDRPSFEQDAAQWKEQTARQLIADARRQQESRALVQQVMVQSQAGGTKEYFDLDGFQNADMAEAEVEEDPIAARDAWEVRELERILEEYEVEQERQREEQERLERRRRPWRDVDASLDATATDRRPQAAPQSSGPKFFHRGAYYMDATEWDATDVRHRAVEYAQTPVLNDHQHRDRSQLPKVMQVKKFGFANQSKYKGLAAEDTTDRKMEILPIVRPKSKGK